jgi:hypothetical protein
MNEEKELCYKKLGHRIVLNCLIHADWLAYEI